MQRISRDGIVLAYDEAGSGSPSLIFVHGWTCGRTVGSGHFHQLEIPDQINAMIERFLAVSGLAPTGRDGSSAETSDSPHSS